MGALFPEVKERRARRELLALVSAGAAFRLQDMVMAEPGLLGKQRTLWVPAAADLDMLVKGHVGREAAEGGRLNSRQLAWFDALMADGRVELLFNRAFSVPETRGNRNSPASGVRPRVRFSCCW